jgi:hypothetical protein
MTRAELNTYVGRKVQVWNPSMKNYTEKKSKHIIWDMRTAERQSKIVITENI